MGYQTKEDLLKKWTSTTEAKAEAKEIKDIREDIATARASLRDSLYRYKKKKLKARSIKSASEGDDFKELDDYRSEEDIREAYGCATITEARMDYLMDLWQAREESRARARAEDGQYHDRVTDMLEDAIDRIGHEYADKLDDYEDRMRKLEREAEKTVNEKLSWMPLPEPPETKGGTE